MGDFEIAFAGLFARRSPYNSVEAQAAVERYFAWLNEWVTVGPSQYGGIGCAFAANVAIHAQYDAMLPGLSDYIAKAIDSYAL